MHMTSLIARRQLLGWLALSGASVAPAATRHKQAPAPASAPSGAALMQQLNTATDTPALAEGARGEAVMRAQILLDRIWFASGEIDGIFGANLRRVLAAFQSANRLTPSGRMDEATWKALLAKSPGPVLENYTITHQDAVGPFVTLPQDMMARAQLDALEYTSLHEALGEKFHCAPAWLRAINPASAFRAGDEIVVPDLDERRPAPVAASIRIDKSERMLFLLDKAGQPLAAFSVSIGSASDPLPIGQLEIRTAVREPMFTFNPALPRDARKGDTRVNIAPGPNNPVGVYWLGLNKPHWGIHGSPEPARIGQAETNGCVRLTNWDVQRLVQAVRIGLVVDVHA